jgi:hypothetical protein
MDEHIMTTYERLCIKKETKKLFNQCKERFFIEYPDLKAANLSEDFFAKRIFEFYLKD